MSLIRSEAGGKEGRGDSSHSDLELVRAALDAKVEARAALTERLVAIPRFIAARNRSLGHPLGTDELAELAQEVQLEVWRKLETFAGRAALETWLYRFCQLGLLKFLERKQRHGERLRILANEDLYGQNPWPPPNSSGAPPNLAELLKHLSKREAQVVRLRYLEELSIDEIAELLALSRSSVKTHCYRGLEKLRDILAPASRRAVE